MINVSRSSSASAPHLWTTVADVCSWPAMVSTFRSVESLSSAPGVGAKYAVRQPGLPRALYEITEWDEGRSFTWAAQAPGVRTIATHTVNPEREGSRLELGLRWEGPLAGVMRVLLARRATRMMTMEAESLTAAACDRP